jgi:hypothetical protein
MDEALAKTGEWPNVAIPAGSVPADVMERYGVRPSVFDEPEWEPARVERNDDDRNR